MPCVRAWRESHCVLSVGVGVHLFTRSRTHSYSRTLMVTQIRSELKSTVTLTTKIVARKKLCNYGYAFDVASVSLFCVRHAEPRDMRAAI